MGVLSQPGSYIDEARKSWDAIEQRIFREIGVTGTIFAMGAARRAGATLYSTTFTTRRDTASGLEATVTTRAGAGGGTATRPYTWATPVDLTKLDNWKGVVPITTFDGSLNSMDTPDAAYWTRVSGAWSAGVWVKPAVVNAAMSFMSKYDATVATNLEWDVGMDASGYPYIYIHDDSVPAYIGRKDATALVAGAWQHLVFIDQGDNATLDIYLNGTAVDDTDDNSGVFAAMEDKTSLVRVGCRMAAASAREQFFSGAMAMGPLGPFFCQIALTAAQVKNLYFCGADALGL